ncbi:LCP family protein [Alkalihalobacillus sp. MEB130]|uniref:LCP family protein n=1 Tax=Alkalihalobacillus sp. MEB130 TaxID=2976704 RepID=UPI0028DFB586|nr:LCP family protein [Alkalihalobacillus sp. MEB130]MDT8859629.1 LCP family protein [Alkalihalobacillus sp. MEB130]
MSTRKSIKAIQKRRRVRNIFLFFSVAIILLVGTGISYVYFQYEAGRTESQQYTHQQTEQQTLEQFQKKNQIDDNTIIKAKEPENNEPINLLLVGVDTSEAAIARTDTIMLAQYNPKNGDAKIASIMRDSYVEIPGRSKNKINASFAFGGIDLLQQTIEHNFGLNIHYYALANFEGFINMVDTIAPNGLEVNIERKMEDPNNSIYFEPGIQNLNGEDTLKYVRFRKDFENDFGRVKRQQEVIKHLQNELFTISGITKIPKVIGTLEPHLETNMRTTKLLSLGRDVVLNPVDQVETMRIPVEESYSDAYYPHAGAVLEIDLTKNRQALADFFETKSTLSLQLKKAD